MKPDHPEAPPTITALTGVRALAALWVFLAHLVIILQDLLPGVVAISPWMTRGALGVDIFFVLSGFVISYNYAERMAVLDARTYRTFLWARFARLYPVHLLTMAGAGLLFLWLLLKGIPAPVIQSPVQAAGNLLLLQAFPGMVPWNPPAWSISCEVVAYALFPLGAALLLRTRRRTAVLAAVAVLTVEIVAVWLVGWAQTSQPPVSWIRIAAGFTVGCLLWAAWRGSRPHRAWDFVAGAAALATTTYLAHSPQGPSIFLVMPLLALFVVAAAGSKGPVRAFLSSRVMEWGGRISYSVYLVHFMLVFFLSKWVLPPARFVDAGLGVRILVVTAYVVAVIAVSAATYHLVEEPARRWLRRRGEPRPATESPVAVEQQT